jgi:hypothetical protein
MLAIEGDAGSPCKALAKDVNRGPEMASRRQKANGRPKTGIEAIEHTHTEAAAAAGLSIKQATGVLQYGRLSTSAAGEIEFMKSGEFPGRTDAENNTSNEIQWAYVIGPIKLPIRGLHQPADRVSAVIPTDKIVKNFDPIAPEFVYRPTISAGGNTIEIPIVTLDEWGYWTCSKLRVKVEEDFKLS